MLLSQDELVELTRRERPAAQARVLRQLGIPYRVHPSDGALLVSKAAAESALGAQAVEQPAELSPDAYEVNIEGIRSYGTKTPAH